MPAKKNTSPDYETLKSAAASGAKKSDQATLKPAGYNKNSSSKNSVNSTGFQTKEIPPETVSDQKEIAEAEIFVSAISNGNSEKAANNSEPIKRSKIEKKAEKDRELLSNDYWIKRN